jgi:predicted transcriptional regulator
MAKASRSSKKQPAFDPSELDDLIFSPAVGRGVGSHLISRGRSSPTVSSSNLPTVDTSNLDTIVSPDPLTEFESPRDLTTVVRSLLSTVGPPQPAREIPPSPSPEPAEPIPVPRPPPSASASPHKLWITENGDLVPAARVKRIRLAQDVINSAEECVYDTLWNAKLIQTEESCRIVQAGYDYLVKRSRLSRKTIQRIVAKLLEKDFIAVETRADIYQRSSTVYRVFSYRAVLEKHLRKGRLYVAKMGPGFSYAQPLNQDTAPDTAPSDLTTVVKSPVTTIVNDNMATVVNGTTVTMVKMDPTTVVKMSPYLLDSLALDNTSSSGHPAIRKALAEYGQIDDDDVVKALARDCRGEAPDCTIEEIVHFIHQKGAHVRRKESRIHNPIGFLATAVPKCFSGDTFRDYRRQSVKISESALARQSEESVAMDRWRREQEASLSDPAVSEQEKHLIRLCLGLNTG